jgi:hypothetical protein
MFGTDDVLRGLHKVFVYQFWVQEDTGEIAADFHPNNAGEIYAGAAQRLVLAEIPPDVGEAGDSKPSSSASAPGGTTSGNAGTGTLRGRGRRGFNPARRVPPQLTPEQVDEFQAVSPERQQEIVDMFRDDPQAVKAIQSGRPLSTVQYVKYVRRDEPLLDDFLKVGFCLWALVIGYGGGCFARYVYGRRMKTSNN